MALTRSAAEGPVTLDLENLLRLSDSGRVGLDVAAVNLACAVGLPGSERLNVAKCLSKVVGLAEHVQFEIDRHAYRFRRNPQEFDNSWGQFCMLFLFTVLQKDHGVTYNLATVDLPDEEFFGDSRNLFIHGILEGRGGTCCSLPVLFVAVGRSLGFPLKLVHTKNHLFARWEDPSTGERFNVECAGLGFASLRDEEYLNWRGQIITPDEVQRFGFLKSLTPTEELASFLMDRGHCLLDNRRYSPALEAYANASSLVPENEGFRTAC